MTKKHTPTLFSQKSSAHTDTAAFSRRTTSRRTRNANKSSVILNNIQKSIIVQLHLRQLTSFTTNAIPCCTKINAARAFSWPLAHLTRSRDNAAQAHKAQTRSPSHRAHASYNETWKHFCITYLFFSQIPSNYRGK